MPTFKNKTCIYCLSRPSIRQGDHIFARNFFPVSERGNLPKVPTCVECNGQKAALESYLMSVLPFGGRHNDAVGTLENDVPKRLAKNKRLHRELRDGLIEFDESVGGMTLPFDGDQLCGLTEYIVKGLVCHHWGVTLPPEYAVRASLITVDGESLLVPAFQGNAAQEVNGNVGNGAFIYRGRQATDLPQLTVWAFSVFGGLETAGDPDSPGQRTRTIFAMTGRRDFVDRFFAGFEPSDSAPPAD